MNTHYDELESIIKNGSDDLNRMNRDLLDFSIEKGSSDNISIILVQLIN